jgi:hypothetical protein
LQSERKILQSTVFLLLNWKLLAFDSLFQHSVVQSPVTGQRKWRWQWKEEWSYLWWDLVNQDIGYCILTPWNRLHILYVLCIWSYWHIEVVIFPTGMWFTFMPEKNLKWNVIANCVISLFQRS